MTFIEVFDGDGHKIGVISNFHLYNLDHPTDIRSLVNQLKDITRNTISNEVQRRIAIRNAGVQNDST